MKKVPKFKPIIVITYKDGGGSQAIKKDSKYGSLGLGGPLLLLAVDFAWFWMSCRAYTQSALRGTGIELVAATPQEAIVVLAGDSNRIPMALRLLRERNGPLVLLSGVEPGIPLVEIVNSQGSSTVDIHKTWERIVTESRSRTTIENAEEAAPILKEKQITRIILVTSDYHMPRAKKIFQKTIPEMELYEYPVASDFSELHFSGMRKFFAEFWKNFFYSVGILRFFS